MPYRTRSHPRPGLWIGLSLVAVLLIGATPAHAQWKWRDAQGRVTVSDVPPPHEIPDKDILQRPNRRAAAPAAAGNASAAPAAAASAPVDRQLEARKQAAEQQQREKAKAEEQRLAAIRADNCRRARTQLATVQSGQRMARINDNGEREVLDDAMRADEARRAREVIASECR
jgi:hypothetical protein